jgi:hypothetical protein
MMILCASVANPRITLRSAVLLLPGSIAPPDTTSAGGTNYLIRQTLSSNRTQAAPPVPPHTMISTNELIQDGTFYHRINATNVQYDPSNHDGTSAVESSSLMDGGANGGMTDFNVPTSFLPDFPASFLLQNSTRLISLESGRMLLALFMPSIDLKAAKDDLEFRLVSRTDRH